MLRLIMEQSKDGKWIELSNMIIQKNSVKAVFFISGGMSAESSVSKMRISYMDNGAFHSSEVVASRPQYEAFIKLLKS